MRPNRHTLIGLTALAAAAATATSAAAAPSAELSIDHGDAPVATASTFDDGSMAVTNTGAPGDPALTGFSLTLDPDEMPLRDLAYDPVDGSSAGDEGSKSFTAVQPLPAGVTATAAYQDPLAGGYRTLSVSLGGPGLAPGETMRFSIDVDPTSITGLPRFVGSGPGQISGAELTGALFSAGFADGAVLSSRLAPTPVTAPTGARAVVPEAGPRLNVSLIGAPTPAVTSTDLQRFVVSGAPNGTNARIMVIQSELRLSALPGYDVQAFESNFFVNSRVQALTFFDNGAATQSVRLQGRDAPNALVTPGLNIAVAYTVDGAGRPGPTSTPVVIRYIPPGTPGALPTGVTTGGTTGTASAADAAFCRAFPTRHSSVDRRLAAARTARAAATRALSRADTAAERTKARKARARATARVKALTATRAAQISRMKGICGTARTCTTFPALSTRTDARIAAARRARASASRAVANSTGSRRVAALKARTTATKRIATLQKTKRTAATTFRASCVPAVPTAG